MDRTDKFIEICVGIGMNQFFPEYIKIPLTKEEIEFACPMCTVVRSDDIEENN